MNVVILMLAVTACYTICSLNDKYAAAKANLSGDEFTFLMCSSMSVFLVASLPFQNLSFSFTWQSAPISFLFSFSIALLRETTLPSGM